ncbi:MAG TPA: glycosyltransferase family 9 protein [Gemmatimonadaceae bacterium]|jgi:ADP-heptose:LPS heptosyltransferase
MGATPVPRRILLVALDNLGDLVFASALTPPLHRAFPDATIDVWSKQYTADVAALIPHVGDVIAADPFWAVPYYMPKRPSVLPFVRSIADVRRRHYDLAVLSEAPWRVAAATRAAAVPMRLGLARHRNGAFLTHVLPSADVHKPVLQEQARLLSALGIESPDPRYRLDASRLGAVRDTVARALPARFVAVHPFAADRDRCASLTEWTQLAFALHSRKLPVLWLGLRSELDELRRSYTHPRGFYGDEISSGSLAAGAAAISLATVFVGHDSGPLHVAGAFGVPVVGVFAPGQPDRTFPQGVGPSRMLHRLSPSGITSAMILHEIDALLLTSAS